MSLPLNKNRKFHQGYFHPKNKEKYLGWEVPIYRSGIELKFMKWCDDNDNVLKWSSEAIKVPYYDLASKKQRTYYVDNYVEILEGEEVKKYLVEIKDHKEAKKPVKTPKKKKATLLYEQTTWLTNTCKWKYAKEYAKLNNMEFLLLAHSSKGFDKVSLDFL